MTLEYHYKARRLVLVAQEVAFSGFDALATEFPIIEDLVDDRRLFVYLMIVAGVVAGVAHADLSDEGDEFNNFCDAAWQTLHELDFAGFEPCGENSALTACNSLVDFAKDYRTSEVEYFWAVGYWIACNLKRGRPSEKEMEGANAISGFLKVVFTEWWNNDLLLWLSFSPDEPDIFRSGHVRVSNKIAEAGGDLPDGLPTEEKERLVREQREGVTGANKLIYEASTHSQAKQLLLECLEEGKQFAFFLRSFETESTEKIVSGDHPLVHLHGEPTVLLTAISFVRKANDLIEATVRERIPIVGIANPTDILYRSTIPQVEVPNEHWYQVMEMIAERARVIVILFSQFSAGLSAELTVLSNLGRKDSTVIVVQEEVDNWIFTYARQAAGEKDFERLEWDSLFARLSEYGTVIRGDDIETRLSGIVDDMLAAT